MLKRSFILCGLFIMALVVSSCILDPDEKDKDDENPGEVVTRQDLTQKWHVLNNIEYAYKQRRIDVYDELLNTDFTFFFAPGDVGGEVPDQWGRDLEKDANTRLFLSNEQSEPPADPVCRSIRLDLQYDKDTVNWVDVIPENFPDEVWQTTTIVYSFTFEMAPDNTYIAENGAKAQFTIRNVPQGGEDHWTLVEFRDLGNN
jgi:hypothetical protein